MNDDQTTNAAPAPQSRGAKIDRLVDAYNSYAPKLAEAQATVDRLTLNRRDDVSALVELVGRPGAAQLLGITGRKLAGILRGSEAQAEG